MVCYRYPEFPDRFEKFQRSLYDTARRRDWQVVHQALVVLTPLLKQIASGTVSLQPFDRRGCSQLARHIHGVMGDPRPSCIVPISSYMIPIPRWMPSSVREGRAAAIFDGVAINCISDWLNLTSTRADDLLRRKRRLSAEKRHYFRFAVDQLFNSVDFKLGDESWRDGIRHLQVIVQDLAAHAAVGDRGMVDAYELLIQDLATCIPLGCDRVDPSIWYVRTV